MTVHKERPQIFLWSLHIPVPVGLPLQLRRCSDPFLLMRETGEKCQISQQRERKKAFREPWAALRQEGYELELGERNRILSDSSPAARAAACGSVKRCVSRDQPEAGGLGSAVVSVAGQCRHRRAMPNNLAVPPDRAVASHAPVPCGPLHSRLIWAVGDRG